MVQEKQKISLVIPVRNDNYNGNFIERLNLFLESVDKSISYKKNICLETLLVDWNSDEPIDKKIFLRENNINLKIIHCTKELIDKYNLKGTKFNPSLATNVGIRRATNEYVCIINGDAFLKEDFFNKFLEVIHSYDQTDDKIFLIPRKFIPYSITKCGFKFDKVKNYVTENDLFLEMNNRMSNLVSGYGVIIAKKDIWENLSGLNEFIKGLGWGDIEFGLRASKKYKLIDTQTSNLFIYDQQQSKKVHINTNEYKYLTNNKDWGLKSIKFEKTNFDPSINNFIYKNKDYLIEYSSNFKILKKFCKSKYLNFKINFLVFSDYIKLAQIISLKNNIKFLLLNQKNLDIIKIILTIKYKPILKFNILELTDLEDEILFLFYNMSKERKNSSINIKVCTYKSTEKIIESSDFLDIVFVDYLEHSKLRKLVNEKKFILVVNDVYSLNENDNFTNVIQLNNYTIYFPIKIKNIEINNFLIFLSYVLFKFKIVLLNAVFFIKKNIKKFYKLIVSIT